MSELLNRFEVETFRAETFCGETFCKFSVLGWYLFLRSGSVDPHIFEDPDLKPWLDDEGEEEEGIVRMISTKICLWKKSLIGFPALLRKK